MQEKKRVAVLMGGMSAEHDVSLVSGSKVVESLSREKYELTPITIRRSGEWQFPGGVEMGFGDAVGELGRRGIDCVFIALHGPNGEDGRIQGVLDLLGIPYTCSGCAASAIAMDKLRCKTIVKAAGVCVADHVVVTARAWERDSEGVAAEISSRLGYPCVVKPASLGSSVGMSIPGDGDALRTAIPGALHHDATVLVEQFVAGREITCGVLDVDGEPRALPITEIRPLTAAFFDYHAKYTPGASQEITPAELGEDVAAQVRRMAVAAHVAVGCSIWSRSDMIVGSDGPVWIEVNTVPGMTPTSLYPQAAAAAGIAFPALMELFVETALSRRTKD